MNVSKLTSISLCDKADTVQDSISKANRGFSSTESILQTRNNSYTKKVYKAFSTTEELKKISVTKGKIDIAKVEHAIKIKIAEELTRINSSFLALIARNINGFKYPLYTNSYSNLYEHKVGVSYQESYLNRLDCILFKIIENCSTQDYIEITGTLKNFEEIKQEEITVLQLLVEADTSGNSTIIDTPVYDKLNLKIEQQSVLDSKTDVLQTAFELLSQDIQLGLEIELDSIISSVSMFISGDSLTLRNEYLTALNITTAISAKINLTYAYAIKKYSTRISLYFKRLVVVNSFLLSHNETLFPTQYYTNQLEIENKFKLVKDALANLNKAKVTKKSEAIINLNQQTFIALVNEYKHLTIKYSVPLDLYYPSSVSNVYFAYLNFLKMTVSSGLVGFTNGTLWANTFYNKILDDRAIYNSLSYGDPVREQYAYVLTLYPHISDLIPKSVDTLLEPKIESIILSTPDPVFYANKYLLQVLGHPTLQNIYPNNMDNNQLYKFVKVSVDKNNPCLIQATYKLDFEVNKPHTLEFVIPDKEVHHIVCTFNNGYSGYDQGESYLFYTDEDFDFKIKDSVELDKKSIPYIPVKEAISFVSTEENTLLLKKLFIPFTQLSENISKLDNLPHLPNIGIQLGISTNTLDANCCKYLIQFFEDIQANSSSKEEFDNYDLSVYLFENIITFTSKNTKTKIGFSYIEINTKQGAITPKSSISSSINYEIEFSPILGIASNIKMNTFINRNSIYYDFSSLKIVVQISKTEYKEMIIHGFTYTNEYLTDRVIKPVEDYTRRLGLYESTLSKTNLKYRKATDTVRNEFKSSKDCSAVIPLIYYDIFDANSDYHTKKMYNILENLYYDSINLIISSGLKEEEYINRFLDTYLKPTDRDALLLTYLNDFLNKKPNEVYTRKREEDKTTYELFRDSNYVGIGLSYYNTNPEYLKSQKKREAEVRNLLMQGSKSNLYNDRDSHINNALTGVYKPKVFIEPLINIGDKYKKPMFNN